MRAGGDKRGSTTDRRRRRLWLLATFDTDLGPDIARCHLALTDERCHRFVDEQSMTVDRIEPGGSYEHGNIRPACWPCQLLQGALIGYARRMDWHRYMAEAKHLGIEWDGEYA